MVTPAAEIPILNDYRQKFGLRVVSIEKDWYEAVAATAKELAAPSSRGGDVLSELLKSPDETTPVARRVWWRLTWDLYHQWLDAFMADHDYAVPDSVQSAFVRRMKMAWDAADESPGDPKLLSKLRGLAEILPQREAFARTSAEIVFDPKRMTVACGGEQYPLKTEERCRVLRRLIENQDRFVPSDDLKQFPGSGEKPDRVVRGMRSACGFLADRIESSPGRGGGFLLRGPARVVEAQ